MTPKQSLTRKRSLIRRSFVVLGTVLLATAWAVGISTPASAAPAKALEIVSAKTTVNVDNLCPSAERCAILVTDEFEVVVRVVDRERRASHGVQGHDGCPGGSFRWGHPRCSQRKRSHSARRL